MLKPVITILLYLFTPMLFGQSLINMKHYSVQDGLSQKNVHNFIQDDNGYIWMSTWNGLERFDGYSFYNYKTYPESPIRISNHRFTKIKKSSLNNIWCLTYDKRCYLFNTRTLSFLTKASPIQLANCMHWEKELPGPSVCRMSCIA